MIDCKTVLSEIWDWLAEQDAHPLSRDIRTHLDACPGCRAEADTTDGLRVTLKASPERPSEGFDERLRKRLEQAGIPATGIPATGIPATGIPATGAEPVRTGRVVKVDFWKRPLALVATGAAAVLLIGLAADRVGGPAAPPGAPGIVASAPAAGAAALRTVADPAPIGVLGDRAWVEEDSLAAKPSDPASAEPLQAVSSQER